MNIINLLVMFMLLFLSSCALNKLFDYYKLGTHKYLFNRANEAREYALNVVTDTKALKRFKWYMWGIGSTILFTYIWSAVNLLLICVNYSYR